MKVASLLAGVSSRIRSDYLSPSRVEEYGSILRRAREAGYRLISLEQFVAGLRKQEPEAPALILRHDVDIKDVAGNEAVLEAEIRNEANATYYFRLSTAKNHSRLIRRMLTQGFQVGYHFEEAATVAKRRRLRSRQDVFLHREEIVEDFRRNCDEIRSTWSPHLRSVAAHGDWINRRLGFTNNELINRGILGECGLDFEAYDPEIMKAVDVYVSDAVTPPGRWAGGRTPLGSIEEGKRRVYMLTHERRWNPGRLAKARADASRAWETARFALSS